MLLGYMLYMRYANGSNSFSSESLCFIINGYDIKVIIHLTVLFVLFKLYNIIVCKDTKCFINERIVYSYLSLFNKLMFYFSSNMFYM